jgi:hypoxanthine phosphoribosyltransferase
MSAGHGPLADILKRSRLVYSDIEIQRAVNRLAESIAADLGGEDILILCVMKGAVPLTAALMQHLPVASQLDYIHATRYGNGLSGGELQWQALPQSNLTGRTVLVIDDIFDEGYTLQAIVAYCQGQKAKRVKTAVLIDKQHQRKVKNFNVDYVGLTVADTYVFGFGMDCEGWGRNLKEIYALNEN